MIVAIGNPPSSGSTYLADLLDSLPFAVCGPELNLFAVSAHFLDWTRARENGLPNSRSAAAYVRRQRLEQWRLANYGVDRVSLNRMVSESDSFPEFCEELFRVFSTLRGKDCRLFFEKSPQNIHCVREFLESFPDSYFVHLVRDPLYVFRSLLKRGFPPYVTMATWLIDEAQAFGVRDHERVISLRYEDLV
ncbi:MAG: sulfotransferase, partial [Planctomycetota bacterium]